METQNFDLEIFYEKWFFNMATTDEIYFSSTKILKAIEGNFSTIFQKNKKKKQTSLLTF